MTTFPLKPKRSAGAFLTVTVASGFIWIETEYQLQNPTDEMIAHWKVRDHAEWKRERKHHISMSDRIEVEGCLYVVWFKCDLQPEQKLKVVQLHHERLTEKYCLMAED